MRNCIRCSIVMLPAWAPSQMSSSACRRNTRADTSWTLGETDLGLNHRIVAQEVLCSIRRLVFGKLDEGVQCGAGDADGDAREARSKQLKHGELIEWATLTPLGGIAAEGGHGTPLRNEQVGDGIGVAPGPFKSHDVPDVDHLCVAFGKDQRAFDRHAAGIQAWRAIRFEHRAMGSHPACVATAAGKLPGSSDPEAARRGNRPAARVRRSHGQQCVRIGAENFVGRVGAERCANGGGDGGLRHAPRGAGVGLGQFLDNLDKDPR